jgi:Na+-transporting NADH:ubiquinone oxidoreductase subunit F
MSHNTTLLKKPPVSPDYSLTGVKAVLAAEKGLAEAHWYQCDVSREAIRKLLVRRDGPAIRDTLPWCALLFSSGHATYLLRDNWWVFHPCVIYSTLYASTSYSRWHESGHGTAFKTDWMNNALYEIRSFMVMWESIVWRWSHNRHHSA